MANRTISIAFKLDGDTKSFQILTSDAKKLKAVMEEAVTPAERLSRKLLDLNQANQIFSTLSGVVGGLSKAFGQLAGEYNQVQVNEGRLAQAMRNTMDASDDEIRNIIALADAQERVGVER